MRGVLAHVHMWGSGVDTNHFPILIFETKFLTELVCSFRNIAWSRDLSYSAPGAEVTSVWPGLAFMWVLGRCTLVLRPVLQVL